MSCGARALVAIAALAGLMAAPAVLAQAKPAPKPAQVEDRPPGAEPPLEIRQIRSGMAYRELQQAQFESKLAEQDVLNTQEAYNNTRARADALKIDLDKAVKARDGAKAKEAAARKRYEEALQATSR